LREEEVVVKDKEIVVVVSGKDSNESARYQLLRWQ